jgi:hypothetical protein
MFDLSVADICTSVVAPTVLEAVEEIVKDDIVSALSIEVVNCY